MPNDCPTTPTPRRDLAERRLAEFEEAWSEAISLAASLDTATAEEVQRDHLAIIAAHDRILALLAPTEPASVELEWAERGGAFSGTACRNGWQMMADVQPRGQGWEAYAWIGRLDCPPVDGGVGTDPFYGNDPEALRREAARRLGLLLAALGEE